MGSKNHDEKSTENEKMVSTSNLQLDPGLRDWRLYEIEWNSTLVADITATKVANGAYAAGTEYWQVNTAGLTPQSSLAISSTDHSWTDSPPAAPSPSQAFQSSTAATWQEVTTDLTTGNLYKHVTKDYYVRLVISGTVPNALISKVRWYRKSETAPSASFDPSGHYSAVESVGSGKTWYADSK